MYHELDEEGDACRHCGKDPASWSDHPNFRECPAFKKTEPFTPFEDYDVEKVKQDLRWDADPVTAFDFEAWGKLNENIVRGEN